MKLDIGIGVSEPDRGQGGDIVEALRQQVQAGHMLARMRFDYPDQMLARVATDNGDGTFDCHRPGTDIYMSAVPVASMALLVHIVVGATVLIKFYKRDRRKPRIVRVSGGVGGETAATFYWVSSHGTPRGSFLAGEENTIIDLDVASTWFSGPFGDNVQNNNFQRRPTLSMVLYPIAGVNTIVVLDGNIDATHHQLRAFALDGTVYTIAGSDTWTTAITVPSLSAGAVLPGHLWMQYNADADLLIVMKRKTGPEYSEIEFFSGASGASVGDFLNATDKHIFHLGWTTVGRYILRTYHAHTTTVGKPWNPTETGTQQKILGMQLSDAGVSPVTLTPLWEFHPAQLFDSGNATAPAGAVIRGMLGDFVAPYLATQEAIVVPVAGHMPLASSERRNWGHFSKADLISTAFTPDVAATAYRLDTRECRGWLAALAVADGSVTWKYEFAALAADDASHYVIATDTFGQADVRANYNDGFSQNFEFTYIGLPADQHYDTEALGSGVSMVVTLARPEIGTQGVLGKLYPQYKYWPMGAGYHFDTTTEIQCGDPKNGVTEPLPTSTNAHVAVDEDDNCYMAYLQPYGVVSPIHPYLHPTVAPVMLDSNAAGRLGAKVTRLDDTPTPGEVTFQYEIFDLPYRHTAWRSFLSSWDSGGTLRWRVEITFWGSDYQFSSTALAGAVPYAGSVLRIVPTSTALFVLRTIRIPVAATSTENPTSAFGGAILDYAGHRGRRFCKTVLEAYTPSTGALLWQEVLYDPRDDASATLPATNPVASQPSSRYHCTGGVMYGSESGTPWVIGHFRHGTTLLESASVSKIFTANAAGLVSSRDATLKDILLVGNSGETNKFLPDAPHVIGDSSIWFPWRDDSDEMGVPAYAGKRRWYLRKMTA